jgi:hypothetical protein
VFVTHASKRRRRPTLFSLPLLPEEPTEMARFL